MKQCIENCPASAHGTSWIGGEGPRNRRRKPRRTFRWKDALDVIIGPAERMHHLRSLRSAMFYEAVDQQDKLRDD